MLATESDRMSSLQVQVQHTSVPSSAKTRVRSKYVEPCRHSSSMQSHLLHSLTSRSCS